MFSPVRDASPGTVEYDPFAAAIHADPYAAYARLREHAPLYHNERRGFWAVSRYDDVQAIGRDWAAFSSAEGVDIDHTGDQMGDGNFLEEDPPLHDALRAVVRKRFVPKDLRAALEPFVRDRVEALVEDLRSRPAVDFGRELAWELPIAVISHMLGLPASDLDQLRQWEDRFALRVPELPAVPPFSRKAAIAIRHYLQEQIDSRRREPRDDLLTEIANAEVDGSPIGDSAVGMAVILFIAGNETTSCLLTNALTLLAAHPGQREWLASHPDRIPAAVEEILRYESPVQHATRVATHDVEALGQELPAGTRLLLLYGSANRDERRFDRPDELDVRREPSRNLAFGEGIHHCLGAPLARLEGQVVLETVLREMPDYQLAGSPTRLPSHILRGYVSVPAMTSSDRRG
jgi:cytochrome P450